MWAAKFQLTDPEDLYTTRTKKFKVDFYTYPLSSYREKERILVNLCGVLKGEKENKKKFVQSLKKDKRVKRLSIEKDFMVVLASHPLNKVIEVFYSPKIIHLRPFINSRDGTEYWEVASWDKKEITELVDAAIKNYSGRLFHLKKAKIKEIYFLRETEELTEKQRTAFNLAAENGYYFFPRKTNLKKLAGLMKVSRPTFEEHLRKAEQKLLPTFK